MEPSEDSGVTKNITFTPEFGIMLLLYDIVFSVCKMLSEKESYLVILFSAGDKLRW